MQKLISPARAGDQVLRAFEACCDALLSLEVARAQAAHDEDAEQERHIARAIELVRGAIGELRSASGVLSAPAAGFVLPLDTPSGDDET